MSSAEQFGDHPRRCQARLKRKGGKQCGQWALEGVNYCKFHGGRLSQKKLRGEVRISHLPKFYRNTLSKTLSQAVDEMLGVAPEDQLSLFEELAIMRTMAGDAIKLYTLAEQKGKKTIEAAELMRSALKDVVSVCESAARVSAMGKDKISIHDIQHIVNQIVRVAYSTLAEKDARKFERAIKTQVKLPVKDNQGTELTPDKDVLEMDGTIPQCD